MSKLLTVRVLVACVIGGESCGCNELVRGEPSVLAPYVKDGQVDKSKAGVDYAKSEGAEVRELVVPEVEPESSSGEGDDPPPAE